MLRGDGGNIALKGLVPGVSQQQTIGNCKRVGTQISDLKKWGKFRTLDIDIEIIIDNNHIKYL